MRSYRSSGPPFGIIRDAGASGLAPTLERGNQVLLGIFFASCLSHGEFFTNTRYRDYCEQKWANLDDKVRKIFEEEFTNFGYDVNNQELLVNEWQTFFWESWVGGFIDVRLRRLGESLESLHRRFLHGIDTAPEPITRLFENRVFRNLPDFGQQYRLRIDYKERTHGKGNK
ncbi:MAG: hypothetical protein ACOYMW_05785 [Candidatus Competibacteraceae bacterium]